MFLGIYFWLFFPDVKCSFENFTGYTKNILKRY
jgi:hypothetical protein